MIVQVFFIFFLVCHTMQSLELTTQMILSFLVFWSFAIIFAFCELGAQVTIQFNSINEELCQGDWYLQSIEVQRMLLIFMSNTQTPAILGYGNIVCTRNAFKEVHNFQLFFQSKIENWNLIMHSLVLQSDNPHWFFVFHDAPPSWWINSNESNGRNEVFARVWTFIEIENYKKKIDWFNGMKAVPQRRVSATILETNFRRRRICKMAKITQKFVSMFLLNWNVPFPFSIDW